jgi:hypothetical protein
LLSLVLLSVALLVSPELFSLDGFSRLTDVAAWLDPLWSVT